MKNITLIAAFSFLTFLCQAQQKFVGTWKISSEKNIELVEDNSFVLNKGQYTYSGTWKIVKKKKENNT